MVIKIGACLIVIFKDTSALKAYSLLFVWLYVYQLFMAIRRPSEFGNIWRYWMGEFCYLLLYIAYYSQLVTTIGHIPCTCIYKETVCNCLSYPNSIQVLISFTSVCFSLY